MDLLLHQDEPCLQEGEGANVIIPTTLGQGQGDNEGFLLIEYPSHNEYNHMECYGSQQC